MVERVLKFFPWVGGFLLFLNLLLLDFIWVSAKKREPKITEVAQTTSEVPTPTSALTFEVSKEESCASACKDYIKEEISKQISNLPTPTPSEEKIPQPTPTLSGLKASYIPISSAGSTQNTSWTDIAGTDFYFDLADFPGAKAVRFEVSLQSYLSSDPAYIRLYDFTNKRAVDGSELTTRSSSFEYLQSGNLTIWRGNNLYRIQAKGSSGNVVNFSLARLKVLF